MTGLSGLLSGAVWWSDGLVNGIPDLGSLWFDPPVQALIFFISASICAWLDFGLIPQCLQVKRRLSHFMPC